MKKPKSQDYFSGFDNLTDNVEKSEELLKYCQALEKYIIHLEEKFKTYSRALEFSLEINNNNSKN